jgi:S1-C subfamily serine protease
MRPGLKEPMTDQSLPPAAPQPPAGTPQPPAPPSALPVFAPPATTAATTPTAAASPSPDDETQTAFPTPAGRFVFAPPEPPVTSASTTTDARSKATRSRRPGGPAAILATIVATAVLASGGTYLAINAAADREAATAGVSTVATVPGQSAPPAQPGAGGQPAPATQAPGAQPAPTGQPLPPPAQGSIVDVVKAVSPAVVTITAEGMSAGDPIMGLGGGTAKGSGVIFDASGLVLTNRHVVSGNPSRLTVTLKDGRTLDAEIYGIDTFTDLAIVKVDGTGLPTAPIGDSASIQVGQQVIAIGSPLGEFTDSVTSGIVSAVGRTIDVEDGTRLTNLIQTDTAINPGNSGGPLLDLAGRVIGINTAVAGGAQGIGFSIPIDIARPLLAQASAGEELARAWLGIRFQTIDAEVKQEANLPVDNGAWIPSTTDLGQVDPGAQDPNDQAPDPQNPFGPGFDPFGGNLDPLFGGQVPAAPAGPSIVAGGPAEAAGLAEGDIITAVNGTTLDAAHPLDLVVSQLAPGDTATLTVLRDGQTMTITVTLGTRPANP